MKDKERSSLQLSILTFNVLSENYINKSAYQNYNYQDRYLYIVNWLNSIIISKKTEKPDIILLQEFDQELWIEFKNKSGSKSPSMFDDYLFIYTYFDKGKVSAFKDSISKILLNSGINDFKNLNFFSDVIHPGMVIAINTKKFMILPSCQPNFNEDQFLDIDKLFKIEYLKKENSYNLSELVYTIWPFQNINLFIQNLLSDSKNKDRKNFFRFNPLRFCQSVCLILKSDNIPVVITNVSLEKNDKEMAIAQLNYIHEFNNHIKKKFIVEPNHILVGNIRFSASDIVDSSLLPANIKINYKFTESNITNRKHHDYIITSSDMITPKFIREFPNFNDKQTIYPNFQKKFIEIVSDREKKSGVLNQVDNWPSDHEALIFHIELFNSNKKEIESSIKLSDINKKTSHLFDSFFKDESLSRSSERENSEFHLSDLTQKPYLSEREQYPDPLKKELAQKMIKKALTNEGKANINEEQYNMSQRPYLETEGISNNLGPFSREGVFSDTLSDFQSSPRTSEPYSQTGYPQEHLTTNYQLPLNESYTQSEYPGNYKDLTSDYQIPISQSNPYSHVEDSPRLDYQTSDYQLPLGQSQPYSQMGFTPREEGDNINRKIYPESSYGRSLGSKLNNEFEELPSIQKMSESDFLNGPNRYYDTDNNLLGRNNNILRGGSMESNNTRDINSALQILIDNINKVDILKKEINSIDEPTRYSKKEIRKRGGKIKSKRCLKKGKNNRSRKKTKK